MTVRKINTPGYSGIGKDGKMRITLRTLLILFITSFLLQAFSPSGALSEEFENETALLKKLTNEELVTYFGLSYSLNKYQKKQLLSQPGIEARRKWIERFWTEHDPTPATPENQRRIEHEERVKLARKLFSMKKAPGWDKRGETLIRWGMPAVRRTIPADIGFYRMIPPGEMWYYKSLDMLVAFQNFNLRGEFIYAFDVYGMTGREHLDQLKAISQYLTNTPIELLVNVPVRDLSAITGFNPDNIDYMADPDIRAEMGRDMIAAMDAEKNQKRRNNFYKYLEENPVVYSIELVGNTLPVFFDITAFNGGLGAVRTEFNFEVPASEVQFRRSADTLSASFRIEVMVRDIEFREVARLSDIVAASQTGGALWQGPGHIPGQLVLALKPGYYRIGIEVTDIESERKGVYNTNIELPSMDDRLALSDIMFASTIRETDRMVKFLKGGLQVVPHPLHAYKIPYPLTFYFEMYGLDTDSEGFALYTVDYRIIPVTKRRKGPILEEPPPAISSNFETAGFGSTQIQHLEIATENLWEGTFQLIVSVMDRRTRVTAEKRCNFSILE
ncbi:MAG: GWxTD domain-containing protein [Candidatus Krumholzibacteriota bacterium]|nr:GWxTD domain-containing protein [Candidatus Krumholzibacteriota bacterium]